MLLGSVYLIVLKTRRMLSLRGNALSERMAKEAALAKRMALFVLFFAVCWYVTSCVLCVCVSVSVCLSACFCSLFFSVFLCVFV